MPTPADAAEAVPLKPDAADMAAAISGDFGVTLIFFASLSGAATALSSVKICQFFANVMHGSCSNATWPLSKSTVMALLIFDDYLILELIASLLPHFQAMAAIYSYFLIDFHVDSHYGHFILCAFLSNQLP